MIKITEAELDLLREQISQKMSPRRLAHTLAVEDMTARLCALYCPEKTMELRAAALLHDLTKENTAQLLLCKKLGLTFTMSQALSQKTFHARTAAAKIPLEFPQFNSEEIVNAVRWHTTGHADMTIGEQMVYLADYIDMTRTFPNCVTLRNYFWDAEPQKMNEQERLVHLYRTLLMSYNMTIQDLIEEGHPIAEETVEARNDLICRLFRIA